MPAKPKKKIVKFSVPPTVKRGLFMYEYEGGMQSAMHGDLPSPVAFRMLMEGLVGFLADATSSATIAKINAQTEQLFEEIEGEGD